MKHLGQFQASSSIMSLLQLMPFIFDALVVAR